MISVIADWLTIIGFLVGVISLFIAFQQIQSVKNVAQAAKDASEQTQNLIAKNFLLTEVSSCIKTLDEVKFQVRSKRYEAAMIRVSDLTAQLIQIQQFLEIVKKDDRTEISFEQILSKMFEVRDSFEQRSMNASFEIHRANTNSQLSFVSDELNKWLGKIKVVVEKANG